MVYNEQGLFIRNTGSSSVISGKIMLKHMLYVSSIKKNLLSISRLTIDNNTIVEFKSCCVYVKDKDMRKLLLCRT